MNAIHMEWNVIKNLFYWMFQRWFISALEIYDLQRKMWQAKKFRIESYIKSNEYARKSFVIFGN